MKIITSCRSSDETAFIKIDSNYYIESFLVEPLNEEQIYKIGEQYGIIKKFAQYSSYATLLSSPFYINLGVKHVPEDIDISDENTMRNYIWENVICLKEKTNKLLYDVIFIGLTTDREILYDRINKRVDIMLENGLLEEAKKIYNTNIRSKAVLTPIGYKELFDYFDNKISMEESIELIKQRSRKYAKRQYTWNNHQFKVNWFNVDFNNFDNTAQEILTFINIE